jgi:tetratricopeptide (TPR) repeat protein
MNQGLAALREGALDEAEQSCRASLELFTKFGKQHGICNNLNNLGQVAARRGNTALAIDYFEKSLAIRKAMGEQLPVALTLAYLGDVTTARQELPTARAFYRQALEITQTTQAEGILLEILAKIGPFLAQLEHPILAVETLTCVIHHPTTEHYARSRAEQDLQQLATTINSNDLAEAKTKGEARDIAALTQEILTLLQESD